MSIKDTIKTFVNFNIDKDYYKNEQKSQLADLFRKILFEDDKQVREFLSKFFDQTEELAKEFDLIADEESDEEAPEAEEEETEEEVPAEEEAPEEAPEEDKKNTQNECYNNAYVNFAEYLI